MDLLAAYITTKYGEKQLGLLRLLAGLPHFQELVNSGSTAEHIISAIGMSLFSKDKFIRETAGIYVVVQNGQCQLRGGSGVYYNIKNDPLSTISGAMVEKMYALYPEYASFSAMAMGSMVGAPPLRSVLSAIDFEALESNFGAIAQFFPPNYIDTITEHDTDLALERGHIGNTMKMLDVIHNAYVKMRLANFVLDAVSRNDRCPPAVTTEERVKLLMGTGHAYSWGGPITEAHIEMMRKLYPNGEVVEGTWVNYKAVDPYKWIGSKYECLPSVDEIRARIADGSVEAPRPIAEQPSSSSGPELEVADCPEMRPAILHVDEFKCQDINALPVPKQDIAFYGNEHLKNIYFTMSKGRRNHLFNKASVPYGRRPPAVFLTVLAGYIKEHVLEPITDAEAYLLAAGRVIASKGQMRFHPDAWERSTRE